MEVVYLRDPVNPWVRNPPARCQLMYHWITGCTSIKASATWPRLCAVSLCCSLPAGSALHMRPAGRDIEPAGWQRTWPLEAQPHLLLPVQGPPLKYSFALDSLASDYGIDNSIIPPLAAPAEGPSSWEMPSASSYTPAVSESFAQAAAQGLSLTAFAFDGYLDQCQVRELRLCAHPAASLWQTSATHQPRLVAATTTAVVCCTPALPAGRCSFQCSQVAPEPLLPAAQHSAPQWAGPNSCG